MIQMAPTSARLHTQLKQVSLQDNDNFANNFKYTCTYMNFLLFPRSSTHTQCRLVCLLKRNICWREVDCTNKPFLESSLLLPPFALSAGSYGVDPKAPSQETQPPYSWRFGELFLKSLASDSALSIYITSCSFLCRLMPRWSAMS